MRIWSNDDGDVLQSKVDGYSILLNRTIYGAKTGMGTIYNVDNLQSQNGYMMDINDYAIMCINDDGIISMYADLYTDPSSLKDEDVNILSWDDMIAKANENIAAYYEKYQTRYGKIAFNKVELKYIATADDSGSLCYIPAWVFTQSEELRGENSQGEISQIVCINALDGSCIDIVENAKKMNLWQEF